jgi:hypothetical protein
MEHACCLQMHTARACRTYRLNQNVRPLIWVECIVEKHSRSRTEYLVKARSQFKERSSANNVEILLPLPPDAIAPTVRASQVRTLVLQTHGPWHDTLHLRNASSCMWLTGRAPALTPLAPLELLS